MTLVDLLSNILTWKSRKLETDVEKVLELYKKIYANYGQRVTLSWVIAEKIKNEKKVDTEVLRLRRTLHTLVETEIAQEQKIIAKYNEILSELEEIERRETVRIDEEVHSLINLIQQITEIIVQEEQAASELEKDPTNPQNLNRFVLLVKAEGELFEKTHPFETNLAENATAKKLLFSEDAPIIPANTSMQLRPRSVNEYLLIYDNVKSFPYFKRWMRELFGDKPIPKILNDSDDALRFKLLIEYEAHRFDSGFKEKYESAFGKLKIHQVLLTDDLLIDFIDFMKEPALLEYVDFISENKRIYRLYENAKKKEFERRMANGPEKEVYVRFEAVVNIDAKNWPAPGQKGVLPILSEKEMENVRRQSGKLFNVNRQYISVIPMNVLLKDDFYNKDSRDQIRYLNLFGIECGSMKDLREIRFSFLKGEDGKYIVDTFGAVKKYVRIFFGPTHEQPLILRR